SAPILPSAGVHLQVLRLNLPLPPPDCSTFYLCVFIRLFPLVLCPFLGEGLTAQPITALCGRPFSRTTGFLSLVFPFTLTRYLEASCSITAANSAPLLYPSYWFCFDRLLSSVSDFDARSYPASIAIFRMFARCFCPCFGSPLTKPITCGAHFQPISLHLLPRGRLQTQYECPQGL